MKCAVFGLRYYITYLVLCLLLLSAPAHLKAQDQLAVLSSNIRQTLSELKQQSQSLQNDLAAMSERLTTQSALLTASETEQQRWMEQSTNLQTSLNSMTEQFEKQSADLQRSVEQIRLLRKFAFWLVVILAVRFAGMLAGYILYAKGVKLPRWLDILL